MGVRGVLFDAGGVLIGPVGGRWNPRYDFEQVVSRHVPDVAVASFPTAFEAGQRVLDAAVGTADRTEYHRAILLAVGIAQPSAALLAELVGPAAAPAVEPFPDAHRTLERLRADGVPMAVVSDAWPDLEDHFRQVGLHEFFATFAISAVVGCRKPDPRMYRAGSEGLGFAPDDCLFIDDDPELVAAAIALGYQGVTLIREPTAATTAPTPWITSLDDLFGVVGR